MPVRTCAWLPDPGRTFRTAGSPVSDVPHALIGNIEKDHRRPQHRPGADDMDIQDVSGPHQKEDQHLPADPLKAHVAG